MPQDGGAHGCLDSEVTLATPEWRPSGLRRQFAATLKMWFQVDHLRAEPSSVRKPVAARGESTWELGALRTDPREDPQGRSGRAWRVQGPGAPRPSPTGPTDSTGPWDTADLLCMLSSENRFILQVSVRMGNH